MYYPRFTKAIIHHFLIQEKSLLWRNKIGLHTSKDDYLINSLRFLSAKESTRIYGAILLECLTGPAMKESKAYKTYLGYATDKEHVTKGKRVKRPAKKSTTKPATGVVIREAPMETKSKSKEKEKVDVTRGKGIELLYEVALTEEAQMKEVRKKSLRDFHKTHPCGSGTVAKKPPSVDKITPTGHDDDDSNNEQESNNEDSEQENESDENETQSDNVKGSDSENESEEHKSDSEQEEEVKDDDKEEDEFVHTPSHTDDKDEDNLESKSDDVNEEIVSLLDVHVHHEVPSNQTPTLLFVPVSVIPESSPVFTAIPKSLPSLSPSPLLTTPTPPPTIATINPLSTLPDFASVFQFNDRITALEKEVAELKNDPLYTQVITLVDEHLDTRLGETKEEFMNFLSESLTARIKEQVKDQLPQILPKEVSNFAPPMIEALIKESRDKVTLAKKSKSYLATPEHQDCYDSLKKSYNLDKDFFFSYDVYTIKHSRKDKDKDEDPSAGSDRGFKRRKTSKDAEPTIGPKNKDSKSGSYKSSKSQPKSAGKYVQSEEPEFEVADSNMPQDQ
ncbi:hypothetical protein Tco_1431037 [Tanacetum coccineum]